LRAKNLVRIRRTSQAAFLALFLFLLVESRLPQDVYQNYSMEFSEETTLGIDLPVGFFFELDPLVALSSFLSSNRLIEGFVWAALVLLATLFFGRFFCGFICPLGTLHHLAGSVRPALKGRSRTEASKRTPLNRIKYFILIALILAAFFGMNAAGWMDPISFLFRSLSLAVLPGIGEVLKAGFDSLAGSDIKILNLLSYGAEVVVAPVFGYGHTAYLTAWFIGFLFLFILFLNRIRPRFWCRVLCPLGALLGLFSRFHVLRLEKDETACTHCGRCTGSCQGAASPEPGEQWQPSECVLCFNCYHSCPEDALTFRLGWRKPRLNSAPDMGRRAVLGGILCGVSLPFLGKLDRRVTGVPDSRLIRPPGSLREDEFLELCQRCGLCMKVCPTNVIQPAFSEAGMIGFWTPRLNMIQGYCEYTCTLCGSICPTGAIEDITVRKKIETPIRIGSAYLDRGRCLPWSGNGPCIVCQEHCPTSPKAITFSKENVRQADGSEASLHLPFVDLKLCVGCGICENKCPVRGRPAIRVISAGESRSLENRILL
jgi:polyferredoxin